MKIFILLSISVVLSFAVKGQVLPANSSTNDKTSKASISQHSVKTIPSSGKQILSGDIKNSNQNTVSTLQKMKLAPTVQQNLRTQVKEDRPKPPPIIKLTDAKHATAETSQTPPHR
jgi:hypothetical protein